MGLSALRGAAAFRRVLARGTSRRSNGIAVHQTPNGLSENRYGIAAKLSAGRAVRRNRIRRWTRELLRRWEGNLAEGYDVVIISSAGEAVADFHSFAAHLGTALSKAGLAEGALSA